MVMPRYIERAELSRIVKIEYCGSGLGEVKVSRSEAKGCSPDCVPGGRC
jgi:hypothetical protein